MLCVTAATSDPEQLIKELENASQKLQERNINHLIEFRLDAVEAITDSLKQYISRNANRAIVCMRPQRAGGFYQGEESSRIAILEEVIGIKPSWVDIEADAMHQLRNTTIQRIVSIHDFVGNFELFSKSMRSLDNMGLCAIKGAVAVSDSAQNRDLLTLATSLKTQHVIIGMGEAGLITRARYRHFKSLWTYVAASENLETAGGQPTLLRALELGLPSSSDHGFIALVGDDRISHSKGKTVYNRIFRQKLLPWSYISLPTLHPLETITLARELGAIGASVTIPYKEVLAQNFACDEKASIGATNTLMFRPGGATLASNTDIEGFKIPLLRAAVKKKSTCLILGAGGAARAAVEACKQLGIKPIISARNLDKAKSGFPSISVEPWERRAHIHAEVLINTTPLCGTCEDLWPNSMPINKKIVFDCAVSSDTSFLITKGKEEGSITINSVDMWVVQGVLQMHAILGIAFEESELREQL